MAPNLTQKILILEGINLTGPATTCSRLLMSGPSAVDTAATIFTKHRCKFWVSRKSLLVRGFFWVVVTLNISANELGPKNSLHTIQAVQRSCLKQGSRKSETVRKHYLVSPRLSNERRIACNIFMNSYFYQPASQAESTPIPMQLHQREKSTNSEKLLQYLNQFSNFDVLWDVLHLCNIVNFMTGITSSNRLGVAAP